MLKVFFEPANQEGLYLDESTNMWLISQETIVLFFYLVDTFLSLFQRYAVSLFPESSSMRAGIRSTLTNIP
jgi:hypothetical protein